MKVTSLKTVPYICIDIFLSKGKQKKAKKICTIVFDVATLPEGEYLG